MPYIVRPPPLSDQANDPFYTYIVPRLDIETIIILRDLHAWGWQVSRHEVGDEVYIAAERTIDKAVKKRRRRTQMIYGDIISDTPPPTLVETWEKEHRERSGLVVENIGEGVVEERRAEQEQETGAVAHVSSNVLRTADEETPVSPPTVEEWYNTGIERLEGIANTIDERWRTLPTLPVTQINERGSQRDTEPTNTRRQSILKWRASIAGRLEKMVVCEEVVVGETRFAIKPTGVF